MSETVLLLQYAAFFVFGVLAAVAQLRFYKALWRHHPRVAAPDDDVLDDIFAKPWALIPTTFRATRERLSALARPWPEPEVERARTRALICITIELVIFFWLLILPGG